MRKEHQNTKLGSMVGGLNMRYRLIVIFIVALIAGSYLGHSIAVHSFLSRQMHVNVDVTCAEMPVMTIESRDLHVGFFE
jgi:hypothetical protein